MAVTLHTEILTENQFQLFESLSCLPFITDFYLAGGTGLALQIGHRRSLDLAFLG